MPGVLAALVAALLIPSPAHATPIFANHAGSGAQGFVQPPPRDTPPKTGRATLRGHVVAAANGRPLGRAQVRLISQELRENRLATTDADGGYPIKDLPAGRYILTASKGGYVQLSYGQQRPFEAGKPLDILDGQTIEKIDFALPVGGVVTGRILDEFGDPITDAEVMPMRSQFAAGRRQLVPIGRPSMTNDIGEFRLFGLPPGQYFVSATWRALAGPPASTDDREGYAPTYYPGTANQAEAQRVTVGPGQTITDLNMILVTTRTARVSGTAFDSAGKPSAGAGVMVVRRSGLSAMISQGAQVRPDGSFELSGLPPGEYVLQLGGGFPPVPDGAESASVTITVSGSDISDVRLVGAKASTISGRIIVDPAAARSLPLPTLRLFAQSRELDFGPPLGDPRPARCATI